MDVSFVRFLKATLFRRLTSIIFVFIRLVVRMSGNRREHCDLLFAVGFMDILKRDGTRQLGWVDVDLSVVSGKKRV